MAYERVNWENLPSTKTPVNATNLNKMDKGIANAVEKTGDTMTGDLNMQSNSVKFGKNGNVLWKEDGYGDKFRIIPNFSGVGAENKLIIQSTTGEAGTDPQNWKDLVTIHADSGGVYNGVSGKKLAEEVGYISLTTTLQDGGAYAYRVGNIVIVNITCQKDLPSYWKDYDLVTLSGVTAKNFNGAPIVDQDTGLCADIFINPNSNVIKINKRGVSSITGRWLRGQLVFIAN